MKEIKFQNDAALQIARRYAFFATHDQRPGTRRLADPFFQALSALTGAGKTPILAEAVTLIRNELQGEPIVLWMSKARSVVTQTFNNFNGGKYAPLVEGFQVCTIKELKPTMVEDSSTPLLVLTTTGLFNNKDQAEGDLRIYRAAQDRQGGKSMWQRLIDRSDGQARRPLIIVYDEAHNLSEQQTDILRELEPEAWLLASATIKLPTKFHNLVIQPTKGWVVRSSGEKEAFQALGALKDGDPDADAWMTTLVDSQKVVDAELVKNAIHFDGTTAPMETCLDSLMERRGIIQKEITNRGLRIKPKAIYVCKTNITDDGQPDDPAKPFNLRQAPPIRIWRYLVESKGIDPASIAIYSDLKFTEGTKPDAVVHFSKGDDDFDKFHEGDFEHIIFNLSLQEGWDDPECYLAYIDKSMGSSTQVQQVIGRVLRQPHATHYDSEVLNAAHFFLRVDRKSVFTQALDLVKAKLDQEGAPIAISSSFSGGNSPGAIEVLPRDDLPSALHSIYVLKEEAMLVVDQLLNQFPTFAEGGADAIGTAESASAIIKVSDKAGSATAPEWTEGGNTNPVRLRWLLSLAVRSSAPQAGKIINTNSPKFDVRVQVRSNAEVAVRDLAEKIGAAYFEHSELIYEEDDPFTFGPVRVVKEGALKFVNSLYPQYSKMGAEEVAFARGLDAAGVTWHRNPVSGGYSIPLLSPGDTANFFPDFLAWKANKVYAIDTKGKHLLTEALLRKMFDIGNGDRPRVQVRFVVKGKQDALGAKTISKEGFTIWRIKNNQTKPVYVDTMAKAVAECLK
ncbi:DEAD/DEAH box helicase family protein [Variovorax sp. GB1R11]|uniref:DEAD/DEAH box helicase family protein n=1 Tax=Variovorax sp. GB1R11 TaxID=3443741 RepID=UPI003F45ABC9